jgi:hypothetical protein
LREGHPSVLRLDAAKACTVRLAFELGAAGCTDWEVAAQTGLAKTHVGEILTNPIYAARLRTGEPAGIAPVVDPGLFSWVQTARERRRTRVPGRIVKRRYALRLRCSGCDRYLYGDMGRYRHPAPTCTAFRAARPVSEPSRPVVNDGRIKGHSYPQDWYEDAIGSLLTQIGRIDDWAISEVIRLHADYRPRADDLTLARIARSREDAARRLAKTRDLVAWTATMARLDAEEALAQVPLDGRRLTPTEIVDYLRSLPTLWAASGTAGRQAIVSAIFARIDVLGFERLEYELSSDAIGLGLDAALPPVMELNGKVAEFGRGERI